MNSEISVYVPAFNAEKTIEICINSILKQTIKPHTILVIDDCSSDKTAEILNNFGDKIKVIQNEVNLGLSQSMNIATDNLSTRYVAKIDADVELATEKSNPTNCKLSGRSILHSVSLVFFQCCVAGWSISKTGTPSSWAAQR